MPPEVDSVSSTDNSLAARRGTKRGREDEFYDEDDGEPRRTIQINDADEVTEYYYNTFRTIQQVACRLIAKAWIKALAPRKQSTNPYTGGQEHAPAWWPEGTIHKEPDHIKTQREPP